MTGSDNDILTEVKSFITNAFMMKDLGEVPTILGVTVTRDSKRGTLSLNQSLYCQTILDRFGMTRLQLYILSLTNSDDSQLLADDAKRRCQEITGALVYLQLCTRPDLSFSVLRLARHMNRPSKKKTR
ncbi:unnamed protein product [Discosporangium mesarthrocarpum]